MKITPQRLSILNSIKKRGTASIEEIYEDIKESNPAIAFNTIHRNLKEMTKKGIVLERTREDNISRYALL